MYYVIKDGAVISTEDKARYVKLQDNGVYVLCPEVDAEGIVVNNDYVCHLSGKPPLPGVDTVSLVEFSGADKISSVLTEGAKLAQASTSVPDATVGVLSDGFAEWQPGITYEKQYSLFTYNGKVGFTRQANITAQAHQPPFSTGMEAIYGVRPVPDRFGVYLYNYNMAANISMKVKEGEDVYTCIQTIDVMLWPPSQLPAHFTKDE